MADLKDKGITNHDFGLYVVLNDAEMETQLVDAVDLYTTKLREANISVPSVVELSRDDAGSDALDGDIIDGGHRHEAMNRLADVTTALIELAKYDWVPVRVYKRTLLPDIVLFSKLINDQGTTGVKEDALEKITFYQGMINAYVENEQMEVYAKRLAAKGKAPTKKHANLPPPTIAELLAYIHKCIGDKLSSGYFRHVISASLALIGRPTEYLVDSLNNAEKAKREVGFVL